MFHSSSLEWSTKGQRGLYMFFVISFTCSFPVRAYALSPRYCSFSFSLFQRIVSFPFLCYISALFCKVENDFFPLFLLSKTNNHCEVFLSLKETWTRILQMLYCLICWLERHAQQCLFFFRGTNLEFVLLFLDTVILLKSFCTPFWTVWINMEAWRFLIECCELSLRSVFLRLQL